MGNFNSFFSQNRALIISYYRQYLNVTRLLGNDDNMTLEEFALEIWVSLPAGEQENYA